MTDSRTLLVRRLRAIGALAACLALFASAQPAPRAAGAPPSPQGANAAAGRQIPNAAGTPGTPRVPQTLRDRVPPNGRVRVIVELRLADGHQPEGTLQSAAAVSNQRARIAATAARLRSRLPGGVRTLREFQTVPYVALEVPAQALDALEALEDDVVRVIEDEILRPELAESVPLVEGDQAWTAGYDGSGSTIAILDTGVDRTHPFLAGKVVEEACYSSSEAGLSETFCPSGVDTQIGPGAAAPCPLADCLHGTHVAGIAAGHDASAVEPSGVAPGADLMAVQVFARIVDPAHCAAGAPCAGAFSSDVIAGLERVYAVALEGQHRIAAVNLSLAGGLFTAPCDDQPYKPIIDNLRSIGVATVAAAGNSGIPFAVAAPACISSAVSVGATDKNDAIAWFSNGASFLSLLAPGDAIRSSVPGGGFEVFSGTSMAAPHVAGAWAIMQQAAPSADVATVLSALRSTGLPIADTRFFGSTVVPRVRLLRALSTQVEITNPAPQLTSISPASAQAGSDTLIVTASGSDFNTFSVVEWNGAAIQTRVRNTGTLEASVPAAALASAGSAQVAVFTPAPGGGRTAPLTFTISPGPSLTADASIVAPGATVTVTLHNGVGGSNDWLALAAATAPDGAYLNWTYVGAGVTERTWTVAMPATAGAYEFRLFVNNKRVASSAPVVVDGALSPAPVLSSLSPTTAVAGGSVPLVLNAYGSKFATGSVVRWNGADRPTTFVSSSQLRATIPASDFASAGTSQVTIFTPAPGGGSSAPLAFTIKPQPVLAVNATTVAPGGAAMVTLTDGTGGSGDWLALAATGAANTSYIQYTYVGAGVTTRTWTVNMPAAPGTYEFRLFGSSYTRLATSPVVSVTGSTPVATSLSPSRAMAGGAAFTLTVTGSGFGTGSVVRWNGTDRPTTFVSAQQLRAAIPASDVAAPGTALVTVFSPPPGGGVSVALPFEIAMPPALAVSATHAAGGASVTVTLTNGSGGPYDWIALASASAPLNSYVTYTYVGAGVTTRTWTVTLPRTAGSYEFRLFLNNGYTLAATSPAVVVEAAPAATLTIDKTSAPAGTPVTVTVTNGPGGATDWIALARAGAANTTYLTWIYVGSGVITRTWTVPAPSTPGAYEFRLFLNNGYTREATSPQFTVP